MRFLSLLVSMTLLVLILTSKPAFASTQTTEVCLSNCVQLKQPALRVVALNWSVAEMLLTLDVTPVGITLGNGYRKWQTNHPELPSSVTEIGRRQEPDLATIAALKPDLIIGYEFRHRRILSSLSKIAPTLLYQQFANVSQTDFSYFHESQKVFVSIARAVDKKAQAKRVIKQLTMRLQALKTQLNEAGLANKRVSYGKFVGMGYGLRIFTDKSFAGDICRALGLQYVWKEGLPGKDFTHLQLEQLPELHSTHLILAGNQVDSERMMHSPVWSALPFIKANATSPAPPLFSFGGPLSAIKMAEAFSQSLLQWQEAKNG